MWQRSQGGARPKIKKQEAQIALSDNKTPAELDFDGAAQINDEEVCHEPAAAFVKVGNF